MGPKHSSSIKVPENISLSDYLPGRNMNAMCVQVVDEKNKLKLFDYLMRKGQQM